MILDLIKVILLTIVAEVAPFNNFLTKPEDVKLRDTLATVGNPSQNVKVGDLSGSLRITKSGQVISVSDDWDYFTPTNFTYSSPSAIAVTGMDATKNFQPGDKIKLVQSSTSYLTVLRVTSSQIVVSNTATYSVLNSAILQIGRSRLSNPSGYTIATDCIFLNPADFSYSSATRISIANITPSDYFEKGSQIKLYQASTLKYFYVIAVGANYIDITAGTTYTFTNNSISYIAVSRKGGMIGFPQSFDWTPSFTAIAPLTVSSSTNIYSKFYITGDRIRLSVQHTINFAGSNAAYAYFSLPVNADITTGISLYINLAYAVYSVTPTDDNAIVQLRIQTDNTNVRISPTSGNLFVALSGVVTYVGELTYNF